MLASDVRNRSGSRLKLYVRDASREIFGPGGTWAAVGTEWEATELYLERGSAPGRRWPADHLPAGALPTTTILSSHIPAGPATTLAVTSSPGDRFCRSCSSFTGYGIVIAPMNPGIAS